MPLTADLVTSMFQHSLLGRNPELHAGIVICYSTTVALIVTVCRGALKKGAGAGGRESGEGGKRVDGWVAEGGDMEGRGGGEGGRELTAVPRAYSAATGHSCYSALCRQNPSHALASSLGPTLAPPTQSPTCT